MIIQRSFPSFALGLGMAVSLFTFASAAQAQVTVEPYLGAYWFDDDALDVGVQEVEYEAGPIVGARVLFPLGKGWSMGGGYGYASFRVTFRIPTIEDPIGGIRIEEDAREHLYYGTLEYSTTPDPVGLHLSGELGGATYSPESGGTTSDLLAGFGGGLDFRASERATIRVDARDHFRFCPQPEARLDQRTGLCAEEEEVFQNIELSAGVRVRF